MAGCDPACWSSASLQVCEQSPYPCCSGVQLGKELAVWGGGSMLMCGEGRAGERPAVTGVGRSSPGFFTVTLYLERAFKSGLLG